MEYNDATEFLFGLKRFGTQPGIESVGELLGHLGDPHESVPTVQVAGSNGKGSTARMTERILREAGYSVGLYISPHLEDYRERIRVDGRYITEAAITEFVETMQPAIVDRAVEGAPPTFFEATTALALWYFDRQDVDVAILEVGIGGSKDATSIVDPIASAVTSVTLEHAELLGDTLEEIARDKAHVAPESRPLVTAASDSVLTALTDVAGAIRTVGPDPGRDILTRYHGKQNQTEAGITLESPDWTVQTQIPLFGAHQAENAGVAAALAMDVGAVRGSEPTPEDIARGLRNATWPGRTETLPTTPRVMLDGAHNVGACQRLTETIAEFDYDELQLVVGIMHDKPIPEMAQALPEATRVIATAPELERAADPEVIEQSFQKAGYECTTVETVPAAVDAALKSGSTDDLLLVTGSLYTVAAARHRWSQTPRLRSKTSGSTPFPSRTIELKLDSTRATAVQAEMVTAGGNCQLTPWEGGGETVRVTLAGTDSQFHDVIETLQSRPSLIDIAVGLERVLTDSPASPWGEQTAVMGILNVTPDSFHDGGQYNTHEAALNRAEELIDAGVDIVDVGGESTRPGADPTPAATERDRVIPVIEELADTDVTVSVDTRKASVAASAVAAGADLINDVSGLGDPEMRFVAAETDTPIVLMHSINTPVDPATTVSYDDVVRDVTAQLSEKAFQARKAGVPAENIILDPGLGFGKTPQESFELLARLPELRSLGYPLLVGHSHKSMFEDVGYDSTERLFPTVAASAYAAATGADILRVHDPSENVAAVRTIRAIQDRQE